MSNPRPVGRMRPVEKFVWPSSGVRCSKSILHTDNLSFEFDILLQVVLSAALSRLLFIYLFYDNLATGGSLTYAILLCHVELSKYSTSKFQKKKNKQYAKRVHCFTVIYHISEIRQQR